MDELHIAPGQEIRLAADRSRPEQVHVFDQDSVLAVTAALGSRRPLLVRGEPGTGKTQLAAAVAAASKRMLISYAVDSRTESRDLLCEFDGVMRLGEAQLLGALKVSVHQARHNLAVHKFVRPGPLWWVFNWEDACQQAREANWPIPVPSGEANPENGFVLLIDEIDKAESDVPNGLLEALGAGQFTPYGRHDPVVAVGKPPIIIITTNEERVLPDAFVRRCLVLHIQLPKNEDKLIDLLVLRGRAHFGDASEKLLKRAAKLLADDRAAAKAAALTPLPGQAEFLDLVRAVRDMSDDEEQRLKLLDSVAVFTFRKHPDSNP